MSLLSRSIDATLKVLVTALAMAMSRLPTNGVAVVIVLARHADLELKKVDVLTNQSTDITFGILREITLLVAADLDARPEVEGSDRPGDRVRVDPRMGWT
jgi:peptidoglycan hydrolase-like amidase